MTLIGPTLRAARIRARIDLAEMAARMKIRADYLRAIENEEWDVLPDPVYVKSFLRGYGDYLGLDSTMLLEEFRRRYEEEPENERWGRTLLRDCGHRLRAYSKQSRRFLRDRGHRLRVAYNERGQQWVFLALGVAAAVALGGLIALL